MGKMYDWDRPNVPGISGLGMMCLDMPCLYAPRKLDPTTTKNGGKSAGEILERILYWFLFKLAIYPLDNFIGNKYHILMG